MVVLPKISVIIPVYNTGKYIKQILSSIKVQNCDDIEIICIDDASTDNSLIILKELKKDFKNLYIIENEKNLGVGSTRNIGVLKSKGKYIWFIDSDDNIELNSISTIKNYIDCDPDILIFNINVFDCQKEKFLNNSWYNNFNNLVDENLRYRIIEYDCYKKFIYFINMTLHNKIIKREILLNNNLYFSNLKYYEDGYFLLQCYSKKPKLMFINDRLHTYNINREQSATTVIKDKTLKELGFYNTIGKVFLFIYDNLKTQDAELFVNFFYFFVRSWYVKCKAFEKNYFLKNINKKTLEIKKVIGEDKINNIYYYNLFFKNINSLKNIKLYEDNTVYHFINSFGLTLFRSKKNTKISMFRIFEIPIFTKRIQNDKTQIKILGLPIFRNRCNENIYMFRIFEIPIFTKRIQNDKTQIKILGLPIFRNRCNENIYMFRIFEIPIFTKRILNNVKIYKIIGIPVFKIKKTIELDVSKIISTIKEENRILEYRLKSHYENLIGCYKQHSLVFSKYRNIYKNNEVVILGSGPTLKYYKKDPNKIYIGCNRVFRDFELDFLFMADYEGVKSYINELANISNNTKIFFGFNMFDNYKHDKYHWKNKLRIPNSFLTLNNVDFYYINRDLDSSYTREIFDDISIYPLSDFYTIAHHAFHFALFTGAKKIYIVGCDSSYNGYYDGANQNLQWSTDFKIIINGWKKFKKFADIYYPATQIISINPIGLKGIFHDEYTEEFLLNTKDNNG
ncbi:glycosyltransferase family 2 protein [Campylobacter sp. RM12637]|uniref:glycosyltransferase family 2 protein n=1 Tax=Campylobacter sp. RM12637 TaxID=2735734 RepID=UPI0030156D21|nr:glycosyltransferase family 2 protein [Campylobacter sp. RM12637]